MYLTIAVIVALLIAIPGGLYWLLRPRQGVRSGPFHQDDSGTGYTVGGHSGGGHSGGDGGGH